MLIWLKNTRSYDCRLGINSYLAATFKTDHNYNYDHWGNLTFKEGVGDYHYDSIKKNRLIRISVADDAEDPVIPIDPVPPPVFDPNANNEFNILRPPPEEEMDVYNLNYDANGNITSDGNGRNFSYFSFDKINRVTQGSRYSEFKYATSRARYYKYDQRTENSQTVNYYTAYIGAYEKIHRTGGGKSNLTEYKINLGNFVITERSDGTDEENYLHKDHLGSTISITDKVGAVVQQFVYDPWGKQTKIYQVNDYLNLVYNQPTNRGYTGHEHIRDFDIIHMNGRIYDANIGRFMQADPNIQSPDNFQNYNRYSYVLNNPLSYTDPSGFFFKKLFKAVKKHWRTITSIAIAVYLPGASFLAGWSTAATGAFVGFVAGGVATGSLRGALVGALTGAAFGSLHDIEGAEGVIGHAFTGGIGSVLNGGKFGHGFFSAGFTKALGGQFVKATNTAQRISNAIKAAVIGGTVSRLTGGKFASGAVTGAFSRLLNDEATLKKANRRISLVSDSDEKSVSKIVPKEDELVIIAHGRMHPKGIEIRGDWVDSKAFAKSLYDEYGSLAESLNLDIKLYVCNSAESYYAFRPRDSLAQIVANEFKNNIVFGIKGEIFSSSVAEPYIESWSKFEYKGSKNE